MANKASLIKNIAENESKIEQLKEKIKHLQTHVESDKTELIKIEAFEIKALVNDIAEQADIFEVLQAMKNNDLDKLLELMNTPSEADQAVVTVS